MVFRGSVFNLLRAGSSFRRNIFLISMIGFFCCLGLLAFTSSPPNNNSLSPKFKKTEVSSLVESQKALATLDPRTDDAQLNNRPLRTQVPLAVELLEEDEMQEAAITLPECPPIKYNSLLKGRVDQSCLKNDKLKEDEVAQVHAEIQPGGQWKPDHCQSRYKVAIIIPYRDRPTHLVRLINFLFPILQRQLLDFRFIVTEQSGNDLFNKGRIMNAAFLLAEELEVDCVIFHDVDMFPQDDRVPYDCPGAQQPRHVGAFVSNLGYKLWYEELVGGVLAMTMDQYRSVNGYSNLYWGWGGEDDDMGMRLMSQQYTIERPNRTYARFSMLKHKKRNQVVPDMVHLNIGTAETRWKEDGVNQTDQWNVTKLEVKPLYYHLMVNVGTPPKEWLRHKK